ncbi:ribonuclease H-like domain-containing protein [Tanacetum coccineum]|uniref:Ribonuclease H-like domain-containing protein n=1 Tax=Tanacetum coccineum TaxID=301880 RepID=A0ABQ5EGP8_9ASTR
MTFHCEGNPAVAFSTPTGFSVRGKDLNPSYLSPDLKPMVVVPPFERSLNLSSVHRKWEERQPLVEARDSVSLLSSFKRFKGEFSGCKQANYSCPVTKVAWNLALVSPNSLDFILKELGVWASAMKLALQVKHKMGFINGTCVKETYAASAPLLEQWDKCNVVVLNWILSSLSQDVYLGHVFSNNAATVCRESQETYDRVNGSIVFNLMQKINSFKQARNELFDHAKLLKLMQFLMGLDDVYQPIRSSIMTREILPEAKDAFLIISREESHRGIPPSFFAPLLKPNAMEGVNQHITNSTKNMFNIVDVTELKLTVGHPNGTLTQITHVGSLRLNNDVVLFDVLVVPESEKYVLIGYAGGKKAYKLFSLESRNVLYSRDVKFYETVFPYKMSSSKTGFENEKMSDVSSLNFFDFVESKTTPKTSSLNDEEEGTSSRDDSVHQPNVESDGSRDNPVQKLITSQAGHDGEHTTTPVEENTLSEGNIVPSLEVPVFQNVPEVLKQWGLFRAS